MFRLSRRARSARLVVGSAAALLTGWLVAQPGLPHAVAGTAQVQNLVAGATVGPGVLAWWDPPLTGQYTHFRILLEEATTKAPVLAYECRKACLHHVFWNVPPSRNFVVAVTPLDGTEQGTGATSTSEQLTTADVTLDENHQPTTSAVTGQPTNVTVTQDAGTTAATVRWTPATSGLLGDNYYLNVYDGGVLSQSPSCSWCTSLDVSGLVPGHSYTVTVTPRAVGKSGTATPPVAFQVTNPCAGESATSDTACVTVNSNFLPGERHKVSGILHGFPATIDPQTAKDLNFNSWRLDVDRPDYIKFGIAADDTGGHVTDVLSDHWFQTHKWSDANGDSDGTATPPWQDWTEYVTWVKGIVDRDLKAGQVPEYYDVMNEPGCCPDNNTYYNQQNGKDWTMEHMLEQYLVASRAIQASVTQATAQAATAQPPAPAPPQPAALGPTSSTPFTPIPPLNWTKEQGRLDLDDFLAFAELNQLQLPAISWHEVGSPDQQPSDVARDIQLARSLAKQYAVGNPNLIVNEYGRPGTYDDPGMIPGYLGAFEYNGVVEANRTVWDDNDKQTYAGLFTPTGQKTAVYWPYLFYGQMAGKLVPLSSSASDVSGLAARDPNDGTVRILLGRHANITGSTSVPAVADAVVKLTIAATAGTHTVKIDLDSPQGSRTEWTQSPTTDASGHITVQVPAAVADQSAIEVTVAP